MKKRILIIGISMLCGGTEKAFLAMANTIDYDRYEVDLLLADDIGPLMDMIPKQIHVIIMKELGEMFLLSSKNAYQTIYKSIIKRRPAAILKVVPYFVRLIFSHKKRPLIAAKMWVELMKSEAEPFASKVEYDVAVAYWGDRTMFYMIDKVNAKKKIAWLHFDYGNPPRDDSLYLPYFEKCDKIVTVSSAVDAELKKHLPQIANKCTEMNNINNPEMLRHLALIGETFPDSHFTGKRILSVCRVSEQKGVDFIVPVLKRLRTEKYNVRWYIIGPADDKEKNALIESALREGVADMLILLGTKLNPYSYMRDADIFALPSRYEGKPITVEEAKILFKPIVVSNYVSANEQLNGGQYGIICDIGSEGMYNGVKTLLDDERLCDKFTVTLSHINFGNKSEINKFYDMLG